MTETKILNFNCPVKLLEDFDETIKPLIERGVYGDRTDALIAAMLDLIRKIKRNRLKEA